MALDRNVLVSRECGDLRHTVEFAGSYSRAIMEPYQICARGRRPQVHGSPFFLSVMLRFIRISALALLGLAALLLPLTHEPLDAQAVSPLFYYYEGARIPLSLNPARIAVRFKPEVSESTRRAISAETGDIQSFDARVDEPALSLTLLPVSLGHDPLGAIGKFKQRSEVQSAGRVFQFEDGTQYAETEEFVARFKAGFSPAAIDMFNLANGVGLVREQDFSNHVLILRPLSGNPSNALDLANMYVQSGSVEFAEPNFALIQPLPRESPTVAAFNSPTTPNDPDFLNQWALKNSGQFSGSLAGADINAPAAWGVTTGSSQIKIAIIDEGVDSTNPDLTGKVLPGYSSIDGSSNTQPNANDYHGTSVAGIAAANTNNGQGIAGVCWACQILPVRVAYEDGNGNWVTTIAKLAAGIDWAWSNGADILSNSWTMSAPSGDVTNSIVNARFFGRPTPNGGEFGSTVVFAAGNENSGSVSFPASLNKYVIAVGASNWCDQRKTPTNTPCNHKDPGWGSNYGTALDLLAPGEAIYTTCNGINCASGKYTYFSGTSASTPVVAGIAGLLYSLNPNLQPQDVQNALQEGAKDLSPAGRDDQTGYGRVDAYGAVAALYDVGISVTDNNPLCHPGDQVQYTLTYSNSGMTAMGGAVAKVTLPTGLNYVSSSPVFNPLGGGVYQLSLGTLSRFANGTATFTAEVQSGTEGQRLTLTAQIGGSFPELNTRDNTASDTTAVASTSLFLPLITR